MQEHYVCGYQYLVFVVLQSSASGPGWVTLK